MINRYSFMAIMYKFMKIICYTKAKYFVAIPGL